MNAIHIDQNTIMPVTMMVVEEDDMDMDRDGHAIIGGKVSFLFTFIGR